VAFKKVEEGKHKLQLHSLIDMSFILLLFFLVTSMITQLSDTEQLLSIPTPENKTGRAQILVQIIGENEYLYLDDSASIIVDEVLRNYGDWKPWQWVRNEIVRRLSTQATYSKSELLLKLALLKKQADAKQEENRFVLIRCPDEAPYYYVMDIIQSIAGSSNLNYGCVGGSLADIKNARKINVSRKQNRECLVIEFPDRI